jgi:hypothetical protein
MSAKQNNIMNMKIEPIPSISKKCCEKKVWKDKLCSKCYIKHSEQYSLRDENIIRMLISCSKAFKSAVDHEPGQVEHTLEEEFIGLAKKTIVFLKCINGVLYLQSIPIDKVDVNSNDFENEDGSVWYDDENTYPPKKIEFNIKLNEI